MHTINGENRTTLNGIMNQMLTMHRRSSLHEHIYMMGLTEWNKTNKQILEENLMIGTSYKKIRDQSKTSKLLTFIGADFATMEALCLNTVQSPRYLRHITS